MLDPDTVIRSLSVEKKIVFGAALAAAAASILATTGGGVVDLTTSEIMIDDTLITLLEAAVASGTALVSDFLSDSGAEVLEESKLLESSDLLRTLDMTGALGAFLISARRFVVESFQITIRFITSILNDKK